MLNDTLSENHFYLISEDYINLVNKLGGKYYDKKERPVYCCIKDKDLTGLYWLIPTSDMEHRSASQIDKIRDLCSKDSNDIRSAYYHIGTTNRAAIFKISCALPITAKYVDKEYLSVGKPLVLQDKQQIKEIQEKLFRILSYEKTKPNKLEQHITSIRNYLSEELTHQQDEIVPEIEALKYEVNDLKKQLEHTERSIKELKEQNELLSELVIKYKSECQKAKDTINEANSILNSDPGLKEYYKKVKLDFQKNDNNTKNINSQTTCPKTKKNNR